MSETDSDDSKDVAADGYESGWSSDCDAGEARGKSVAICNVITTW